MKQQKMEEFDKIVKLLGKAVEKKRVALWPSDDEEEQEL
jgi:hypothetical protein